jgi:diguanylate cyclase (GGDEF)-like protein
MTTSRVDPAQATRRGTPGDDRDRRAEERDERAEARDVAAKARDTCADERDGRAEALELAAGGGRAEVIADRAAALSDRCGGSDDRDRAAEDRHASASDRTFSAEARAASSTDGLTGARRREAGVLEFQREIDRAKRTQRPFTAAFVDVDGLKAINDTRGHSAGDQLLVSVARALHEHLRSYDLIVRYGGDEFLCALPGMTSDRAAARFVRVNRTLAEAGNARVTVGLAELTPADTLDDLVARADQAMYGARRR